jgi:hypothetical protein
MNICIPWLAIRARSLEANLCAVSLILIGSCGIPGQIAFELANPRNWSGRNGTIFGADFGADFGVPFRALWQTSLLTW